jgi:hypothetical protein
MTRIEELHEYKDQLYRIANRYGIRKVYVFGSVARGEERETSDVDFLIEMEDGASALGVGGFQFEVQQLLGLQVDVVPTFALPSVEDRRFVNSIQAEAISL